MGALLSLVIDSLGSDVLIPNWLTPTQCLLPALLKAPSFLDEYFLTEASKQPYKIDSEWRN